MASTTISKTILSSEQSNMILSNGNKAYYHFSIPKTQKGLSKIKIDMPISCGSGKSIQMNIASYIGSKLTFYYSFDNGSTYTKFDYGLKSLAPNFNGIISFELTTDIANVSNCIIGIDSERNYSVVIKQQTFSESFPDATLQPATLTAYTNAGSSSASIGSLSPSNKTLVINQAQVFSWTLTSPGEPQTQTLYYKLATASSYKSINVGASSTSYTFAKGALSQGSYLWYVKVSDTWGYNVTSQTAQFVMGSNPTVSITYPTGTIWRSIANAFTWTYKDSLNLVQNRYQIQYKLTSETTWTTAKDDTTAATSFTFAKNFFAYAKYNLRIRARNTDGLWSEWANVTFQAGSIPKVSINAPDNKAALKKGQTNVFSWTLSDTLDTGQYAYNIRIRQTDSTSYVINKTVISANQLYQLTANALNNDTYAWQLRVQNNDRNWTDWTSERTFTYGSVSTVAITSPEDGANVRLNENLTVTWTHEDTLNAGQKSFELGYKPEGESSWQNITGTTAKEVTIPVGTLTAGNYNFRLKVENNDNAWTVYQYFNLLVGAIPTLELTYPLDFNIKGDVIQIFTWALTDTLNTGQYSYELGYKKTSAETWTTLTATSENQYYSFAASTLTSGSYQWRVKATNNDGISTDYIYSIFTVIGETDAPVITSVTQSAIPTVTWTVDSQDTFEFELSSGTERIYTSGVQKGKDIRSYTPNIIIPDGNYIIRMRCMNEYGYFTEWLTYSFVLATTKPTKLNCYIFANAYHGVTIARSLELDAVEVIPSTSTSPTPDAIYVLRRIYGESKWNIIGRLSTEDETIKYDDNTVQKGIEYEYALRNYAEEAGYKDSESHLIKLSYSGVILYDGNNFVNCRLSEGTQFEITHTPGRNYSYTSMIGRAYPVKEASDWLSHTTGFEAYVTFAEYKKLENMMNGNNTLWFKGKDFSFACSIDSLSIKAAHLDKGYDVTISLSRVSEEEFEII